MMKQPRRKKWIHVLLALVLWTAMNSVPQHAGAATVYQPTWASVDQHNPSPEWFQDAKFGIYFHWGAFSVPAYDNEWYPRNMYNATTSAYTHHNNVYGTPTAWPYHNFIIGANNKAGVFTQFAPKLKSAGGQFDPNEWAQLFVDAGAKFAGPVAEHHDGFSMWDSAVNEWNSADKGPRLDLLSQFTNAIRAKNLKLLTALHHAYNYTGFYEYVPQQSDPSLKKLYGQLTKTQEDQLWFDKLKEVIDGYQPDIIWQDFNLSQVSESQRLNFLSYYYNKAIDWNKEVVATYKDGFNQNGEVLDYERGGPGDLTSYYWLTDDSVSSSSWSYTNGMRYYPSKDILHAFIDRVSKNGNLLLNIAPRADGSIPQEQKDILLHIGSFLRQFGESIYSTRAWSVYGEGPTKMGGGSFQAPKAGTASDIRFTRNKAGNTLYAIVLGYPGQTLNISTLSSNRINLGNLSSAQLLLGDAGSPLNLSYKQDSAGLRLTLPSTAPYSGDAYVVKLIFSGSIPTLESASAKGATFYVDINYAGASATIAAGTYTTAQLQAKGIANNSISSIRVPAGYRVTAYDGDNFTGTSWTFTTDASNLLNSGNNDRISSVRVTLDPDSYFRMINRTNGLAIDSGGNVAAGSSVKLWTVDSSSNLQWQIIDNGNGYYRIANRTNGMVLDGGGATSNGSIVKLAAWNGSNNNLQWSIVDSGGGYYRIVNRTSGLVLDSGGNVPSGSLLKMWSWDGSPNLQWDLVRVN